MDGPTVPRAGGFRLLIQGRAPLSLKIGEVLEGEVLNLPAGGTVSIRLKNRVLTARTEVPLRQGERLLLRVEGTDREIRLRLLAGPEQGAEAVRRAVLEALRGLRGARLGTGGDLAALRSFLDRLPVPLRERLPEVAALRGFLPETVQGGTMRGLVESSGVLFETKLRLLILRHSRADTPERSGPDGPSREEPGRAGAARKGIKGEAGLLKREVSQAVRGDLKGMLLRAKEALNDPGVTARLKGNDVRADELVRVIEKLLGKIEYHQLQSRLNETLQTFLPFLWRELKDGELVFRRASRDRCQGEFHCFINLDLEGTGRVSASLLMQSGRFHVRFTAENRAFLDFLKRGSGMLKEQLESAGLGLAGLTIRHEERMDFEPPSSEGLDIRI